MADTRTALDWARAVKPLIDHPRFSQAERITLVCATISTRIFWPRSIKPANRPKPCASSTSWNWCTKHGSWLHLAESGLSGLTRQCLERRIADLQTVAEVAAAWNKQRSAGRGRLAVHHCPHPAQAPLSEN
jgi:hypothetical protein